MVSLLMKQKAILRHNQMDVETDPDNILGMDGLITAQIAVGSILGKSL